MTGGLYRLSLSDTHYYVGRASNFRARWQDHLRDLKKGTHSNPHMQRVYNLHHRLAPEILFHISSHELRVVGEQTLLDNHLGQPGCLNIAKNARSQGPGWPKGRPRSEDTKRKISLGGIGRKQSPEAKAKQIATLRDMSASGFLKRSNETRKKNSIARKGKPISEATKSKMSKSHKENPRIWSEDARKQVAEKVRDIWAARKAAKVAP